MSTGPRAVMYVCCDVCDAFHSFNLGEIRTNAEMLAAWGYVNDLKTFPCESCGSSRWQTSINFGLVKPTALADTLINMVTPPNSGLTPH